MSGHKKHLTIGYQVSGLENGYDQALIPGVFDVLNENSANLLIFTGKAFGTPIKMHSQHHVVYDLINKDRLDGLIMLTGTLCSYVEYSYIQNFYQKFFPLPLISVGVKYDDIHNVLIENAQGMKEAVRHLIEKHGCKRIAFIRGPHYNEEAELRYKAYLEVLAEKNITVDNNIIAEGNFSPYSVPPALALILDQRHSSFDALVAANDDMAFEAMIQLKKRGFNVPGDILVIGFDDVGSAQFSSPPLTTSRQPLYELGKTAGEKILELIRGKEVPLNTYLGTRLVIRQSCGCNPDSIKDILSHPAVAIAPSLSPLESITRCKQACLSEMIEFLTNHMHDSSKARISAEKFLDAMISDLESDQYPKMVYAKFNQLIMSEIEAGNQIKNWQSCITFLHNHFKVCLKIDKYKDKFVAIIQLLRISFNDMTQFIFGINLSSIHKRLDALRYSIQSMVASFDFNNLYKTLAAELPQLGIKSCYLSKYDTLVNNKTDSQWKLPEYSTIIFAFNEAAQPAVNLDPIRFKTADILPDNLLHQTNKYSLVVMPTFFAEDHFGFIFMDLGNSDEVIHETLRVLISSVFMGIFLVEGYKNSEKALVNSMNQLEKANNRLQEMSLTDELTGLNNRRGFIYFAENQLKISIRNNSDFLIMFADLDGLKKINDTYGHKSGDEAIISATRILKETFRNSDIIARLGGDEFVILMVDSSLSQIEVIQKRLTEIVLECNAKSDKPFQISISIGFASLHENRDMTLEQLMNLADERQYVNKQAKKSR